MPQLEMEEREDNKVEHHVFGCEDRLLAQNEAVNLQKKLANQIENQKTSAGPAHETSCQMGSTENSDYQTPRISMMSKQKQQPKIIGQTLIWFRQSYHDAQDEIILMSQLHPNNANNKLI